MKNSPKLRAIIFLSVLVLVACLGITARVFRSSDANLIDPDGGSRFPVRARMQQNSQSDFRIEVGGDPGVAFRGYITVMSGGGSQGARVEGTTPAGYSIAGDFVSVMLEKHDNGRGDLVVHILKKGVLVKSSDTAVASGVVTLAASR